MSYISEEKLLEAQQRRYATKIFDRNRGIPNTVWQTVENCVRSTPSSYNAQPWKFIVVTDEALKIRLRTHSFNQAQVEDCSHFVIICARETIDEAWLQKLIEYTALITGVSKQSLGPHGQVIASDLLGFRAEEIYEINIRQCYIALGNLILSATLLGLDTCPLEGFIPSKYDEVLGLEGSGWKSCICCAVGFRSTNDKYAIQSKVRFPLSEIFEHRGGGE